MSDGRRRAPSSRRIARAAATTLLAAAFAAGCAHAPPGADGDGVAITPDSVTTALWHMDETGGTSVYESGRFHLEGRAGVDTRTDFGRVRSARLFTRSIDSFVWVPYNPVLESPTGLTVEAWIYLNAYGQYEDTPIAARWTQAANEQSWMFSVLGLNMRPRAPDPRGGPFIPPPSPGYHDVLIAGGGSGPRGRLMFVFQPDDASALRAYFSTRGIPLTRWVHVAVTFDETVVRIWIDGEMDAQFATRARIRTSRTGLLIGNYFDPRWLSDFSGDLRVLNAPDKNPYYAFDGFIDELRVSKAARPDFDYAKSVR